MNPDMHPDWKQQLFSWSNFTDSKESIFKISIELNRLYIPFLISIFMQTFLLWFLAYLTLIIKVQQFFNQFLFLK